MILVIRNCEAALAESQSIEVVERKGLGHPDTICDAIAEKICVHLCRYYLEHFGRILHHNVDKVLLVGGRSKVSFGGGKIVEPIEIYLAGRATREYQGKQIPVEEIAVEACRKWLIEHLPGLNVSKDVKIIPRLRPGSSDLTQLFETNSKAPLANDTSCGVGFAPFTDLEKVVLEVEKQLNIRETKRIHPEIGQDIKIMGIRQQSKIQLTIGCAFVSRFIQNAKDYLNKKHKVHELVLKIAREITSLEVNATINAADDAKRENFFLTVSGTSAESGDDGEVGRGNRACGLITPYRVMTLEAAAGKNPVSHVGKIYNLIAGRMASSIAGSNENVANVECVLVSKIGELVTDPQIADIRLTFSDKAAKLKKESIKKIVCSELDRQIELREALLNEKISVY